MNRVESFVGKASKRLGSLGPSDVRCIAVPDPQQASRRYNRAVDEYISG
jgi:hypothetical protein